MDRHIDIIALFISLHSDIVLLIIHFHFDIISMRFRELMSSFFYANFISIALNTITVITFQMWIFFSIFSFFIFSFSANIS